MSLRRCRLSARLAIAPRRHAYDDCLAAICSRRLVMRGPFALRKCHRIMLGMSLITSADAPASAMKMPTDA